MEFDDVGSSDLRELWESYLAETQAMGHDVSIITRDEDNWGTGSSSSCISRDKTTPYCVVLRDRLMTDAALGGPRPIKSEHSYSLLASSPPASPAAIPERDSHPNTQIQNSLSEEKTCGSNNTSSLLNGQQVLVLRNRIDDMEEECFPAISLNRASGRGASAESPSQSPAPSLPLTSRSNSPITMTTNSNIYITSGTNGTMTKRVNIKEEPFSPEPSDGYTPSSDPQASENVDTVAIEPYQVHFHGRPAAPYATSDSDDDEIEYYQSMELEESNGEPSTSDSSSIAITIGNGINSGGNGSGRQGLPPTPPSSASSDSEGTASASCSPERRVSDSLRGLLAPRFCAVAGNRGTHIHGHVTRQPIHTPLISCQPKGSTGILTLTEEEKRTLIAEGYPVPTKLPLTKQEEKSLKKVRRKIKNKISAQESRRKKKEYMDGLERRVTILAQENSSYKDRLTNLEGTNRELMRELQRLQTMLRSS